MDFTFIVFYPARSEKVFSCFLKSCPLIYRSVLRRCSLNSTKNKNISYKQHLLTSVPARCFVLSSGCPAAHFPSQFCLLGTDRPRGGGTKAVEAEVVAADTGRDTEGGWREDGGRTALLLSMMDSQKKDGDRRKERLLVSSRG